MTLARSFAFVLFVVLVGCSPPPPPSGAGAGSPASPPGDGTPMSGAHGGHNMGAMPMTGGMHMGGNHMGGNHMGGSMGHAM